MSTMPVPLKAKQPPQILPKPPGNGSQPKQPIPATSHVHSAVSQQAQAQAVQQQGTLVFNQALGGGQPVVVQQQTSSGVQLILRSPPPQQPTKTQTGGLVLSQMGGIATPQGTVLLQGKQQGQQVRIIENKPIVKIILCKFSGF